MTTLYRHPLYKTADAFKQACLINGFTLLDNGERRELEQSEISLTLFHTPEEITMEPITVGNGVYALRSRLLPAQLPSLSRTLPIRAITVGRVYDQRDDQFPQHLFLEGVIAEDNLTLTDLQALWNRIGHAVYGIRAAITLEAAEQETLRIVLHTNKNEDAVLGYIGPATWIARALLGQEGTTTPVWFFTLDIDAITIHDCALPDRASLYDTRASFLQQFPSESPAIGFDFSTHAANILRRRGYLEFIGEKIYTSDAYIRMNMVQEAWDTNNRGIMLTRPLQNYHNPLTPLTIREGLPTVLTPALEQALSDNFRSGESAVRLFELGHIFKPGKDDREPWEVVSLSFGAYAPNLTIREFLGEVDAFLSELGIRNHFFIPTDMAIAYRQDQCMVILDEKMTYLDGNCGHISPVALNNFQIESEGFMAQFELPTLEKKAAQEYGFVPYEMR